MYLEQHYQPSEDNDLIHIVQQTLLTCDR
ncbi:hypothetical protein CY0110_16907 [Crocosphaera chwakensis CCY0110]|uniref:Uncharacterized protein n=1 Tax=Crocosphaera chwakensis CCY0110 TaxID=391612 RepID=A3II63_9CHRO|nr:hypothetical protein CY0110_16907 [Crocosphaera chwakensis CCY0110]